LRGKTKSFFEDTFILLIVAVLIYGIYSFFFASEEEVKLEEPKVVIENKVETNTYKEPVVNEIKTPTEIKSEPNTPEKVEEKVIETPKVEAVQKEQIEEQIKEKIEPAKVEPVKVEKPTTETPNVQTTQELEEKAKVEAFYSTIREKIYANINKNVDKSLIKNGEFVNIKLTILKDGNYEQLTFVEGNKEYFELFRSSIKEAYPVKIDDSLKNNFPRYFRMKIEF
jgi:outer membrane biosynthesis protein TonB